MKLRQILNEQVNSRIRQKFVKWLNDNDIEFETDRSRSGSSTYYLCYFDTGTDDFVDIKLRFSDHPAGYYRSSVDIDTFESNIKSFEDIMSALRDHGLVITGGKYMGSQYVKSYDLEKGSETYAQQVKRSIPVQRGGKENW